MYSFCVGLIGMAGGVCRGGRQPAIDSALGISFEVQAVFTWILTDFLL